MQTHILFPSPVGVFELGRSFTDEELNFIKGQQLRPNTGNNTSVDTYILNREPLLKLQKFVDTSFNIFFEEIYAPKDKVKLKLTQSWVNYANKGQFHPAHKHPNSFMSGVLYIETDRDKDKLVFHKVPADQLLIKPTSWNLFNARSWWLNVKNGDLLIFPSSLTHGVDPVENENTRISIAINSFLTGCLGEDINLDALHLEGN